MFRDLNIFKHVVNEKFYEYVYSSIHFALYEIPSYKVIGEETDYEQIDKIGIYFDYYLKREYNFEYKINYV